MASNPTLIIPDIHEKHTQLNHILTKYSHIKQKAFLGDWWDSFSEPWDSFTETTRIFKEVLADPDCTKIMGNHCASYRWSGPFRCSGWNPEKQHYIRLHITPEEWDRTVLFAKVGKWLLSHAGLHPWAWKQANGGQKWSISPARINKIAQESIAAIPSGLVAPLLASGWSRGGPNKRGGLLWLDWSELIPISGVNQIVGHTPQSNHKPSERSNSHSANWCIDTGLRHVAVVDGDDVLVETV